MKSATEPHTLIFHLFIFRRNRKQTFLFLRYNKVICNIHFNIFNIVTKIYQRWIIFKTFVLAITFYVRSKISIKWISMEKKQNCIYSKNICNASKMLKHFINTRSRDKGNCRSLSETQKKCKRKKHCFPSEYRVVFILLTMRKYDEKQILSLIFDPNIYRILHRL
jgi:hypothetical protein